MTIHDKMAKFPRLFSEAIGAHRHAGVCGHSPGGTPEQRRERIAQALRDSGRQAAIVGEFLVDTFPHELLLGPLSIELMEGALGLREKTQPKAGS